MSRKDYHVVKIMRMPHTASLAGDLPLPEYQSERAAGLDLLAAIPAPIILAPGQRMLTPTGFVLELPPGIEAQTRPHPALSFCHGVTVLNAPGTVDPDYHGEVMVMLVNLGSDPFTLERGMPIGRLVFAPFAQVNLQEGAAIEPAVPTEDRANHEQPRLR